MKDPYSAMWFEGFREGLKRKVSLVEGEFLQQWTYKLTIGRGHQHIICKKWFDDPVKAIEAGNRKLNAQYKDKFEGE